MDIVVLVGKDGSGKLDTFNTLAKVGFKRIKSYTTNKAECNNEDFIYVTDEEFEECFNTGFMIEKTEVQINGQKYKYGLQYIFGGTKHVAIVDAHGFKKIKEKYDDCVLGVLMASADDMKEYKKTQEIAEIINDIDLELETELDRNSKIIKIMTALIGEEHEII